MSMAKVSIPISGKSLITERLHSLVTTACSRGGQPPLAGKPQAVSVKLRNVETSTVKAVEAERVKRIGKEDERS